MTVPPSAHAQLATGIVPHDASSAAGLQCQNDKDSSHHIYKPWHENTGTSASITNPSDVSIMPSGTDNEYDVSIKLSEDTDAQMYAADGTTLKDGTKIILKIKDASTGNTHEVYNVDIAQDYEKSTRTVNTKITTRPLMTLR